MIKITFKTKKKKYIIELEKGEDFLILLDKFLKKNKIDKREIRDFKVSNIVKNSLISYRIVLTIIRALKLSQKFS